MSTAIDKITLKKMDGSTTDLSAYHGKVVLVVNVASKCGLTPQYKSLEALYQSKKSQGLEILGFPANNFKGQEPGSDAEISEFCSVNYDVHFPIFSKISVLGADQHPLYAALTKAQPNATGEGPFREKLKDFGVNPENKTDVLWNFEKFLINRKGQVIGRFSPDVAADDPRLAAAITQALEEK
jgi:glutathione peroxidase